MSLSNKNELQELFQKLGTDPPNYKTEKVCGTPSHNPTWVSRLEIDGIIYSSAPFHKKVNAEQDVAGIVLAKLQKESIPPAEQTSTTTFSFTSPEMFFGVKNAKSIVLIDLENYPQLTTLKPIDSTVIVGVISHLHHLATKSLPYHKSVIQTAVKDGSDHAISFLAGMFSTINPNAKFYIVSKDHFAEATVRCLESIGVHARHLPVLFLPDGQNLEKTLASLE